MKCTYKFILVHRFKKFIAKMKIASQVMALNQEVVFLSNTFQSQFHRLYTGVLRRRGSTVDMLAPNSLTGDSVTLQHISMKIYLISKVSSKSNVFFYVQATIKILVFFLI